MATDDDVTYGFNREQALELVNGLGQRDFSTRLYEDETSTRDILIAQTGSGITARSGTTAGTGTVTVCKLVSGVITTTSVTVTAYNLAAVAIEGSCYTTVRRDRFGTFIADPPAVTDIQVSSTALQLRRNCDWTTWHTGEDCTA